MSDIQDEIEKSLKKQEKLNGKFVDQAIKKKQQRHVKEKNEPILDDLLENFRMDYAKTVVGDSMKAIAKFMKSKKDV